MYRYCFSIPLVLTLLTALAVAPRNPATAMEYGGPGAFPHNLQLVGAKPGPKRGRVHKPRPDFMKRRQCVTTRQCWNKEGKVVCRNVRRCVRR